MASRGGRGACPTQQTLLNIQQTLLNAEIEQQRKSLEGNTVLRMRCKTA